MKLRSDVAVSSGRVKTKGIHFAAAEPNRRIHPRGRHRVRPLFRPRAAVHSEALSERAMTERTMNPSFSTLLLDASVAIPARTMCKPGPGWSGCFNWRSATPARRVASRISCQRPENAGWDPTDLWERR